MSVDELIVKAGTNQALRLVLKNLSYASAREYSGRFQVMLPDSGIVKSYKMADAQYVIKFGIADY